jgi:hypothetical protein
MTRGPTRADQAALQVTAQPIADDLERRAVERCVNIFVQVLPYAKAGAYWFLRRLP